MTTTQQTTAPPRRRTSPAARGLLVLTVALLAALLLRTFVVQTFAVSSASMEPTLRVGERVVVARAGAQDVQRGDVVVFDGTGTFAPSPEPATGLAALGAAVGGALGSRPGESDFLKRVVGLPGERVTCCDSRERLLVDGRPLAEPYLAAGEVPSELRFDVIVPPGRLWVMGDARDRSADSRAHLGSPGGGTVSLEDVVGRVVAVSWPLSDLRTVPRGGAA